jgi:hypothetical protein
MVVVVGGGHQYGQGQGYVWKTMDNKTWWWWLVVVISVVKGRDKDGRQHQVVVVVLKVVEVVASPIR